MSSIEQFKQSPHKLLVIPGPIEVSDEVLFANAHPSMSHVSPDFIPVLGDCIRMTRQVDSRSANTPPSHISYRTVVDTAKGQPFLIAGSGTLGWDQIAANLVEPGENALVLHSGYFGDSFAECLETYGANVDQLKAEIGAAVSQEAIAEALGKKKYKLLTFTHVDTSTGMRTPTQAYSHSNSYKLSAVLSDAKAIVETVRRVSPETLVALDGVCSVASEEIHMDQWDVDVIITASQKGLGTPPGLSILVASVRAMQVFSSRKSRPTSYYGSWKKWLPVMQAYESGKPSYFATPPVNLIYAFHASLSKITKSSPSLAERYELHRDASRRVKAAAQELGLKQLPLDPAFAANGMTALWYPDGLSAGDILPRLVKKGIVVAGGLHVDVKDKYFRIGHMGITAVEKSRGDVDAVVKALGETLAEAAAEK
ncbi:MAG: PLP-dependent transferase [Lentinula lateritia]|nr:MAG: PLP-dependent transferase [Lentinula lateritia]